MLVERTFELGVSLDLWTAREAVDNAQKKHSLWQGAPTGPDNWPTWKRDEGGQNQQGQDQQGKTSSASKQGKQAGQASRTSKRGKQLGQASRTSKQDKPPWVSLVRTAPDD